MKGLECPYCNKQSVKIRDIFIFPYSFCINRFCRHCGKKVLINWEVLVLLLLSMLIAMFLRLTIDKIISFDFILFDVALYIFFLALPLLLGKKLFKKTDK